jgi:hypothetical protein
MKIIITESQELSLKLRRRGIELGKIDDIIEYQTEIQNPCTFEGPEDYADFCIGQGISFYYCDEGYCDDEDEDDDYDGNNKKGPSEEMWEVREDVELYMENKFYDYLYGLYEDSNCEE